ncbi:SURF1 family protein [Variovorax brevis]|uniref:SURF1 family protein n=1 Tax=Variovorax brevis TaxID=3053503 RepID=UPI003365A801
MGLVALGTWQVERRAWKLALIERVDQRVHAPAVDLPAVGSAADALANEYRHVRLTGNFLHDRESFVQATTELGSGFWVLTPFQLRDGGVVLVNRGFVSSQGRDRATRATGEPQGEVSVAGLVRVSEPGGGYLRRNDPAANRWYSRDVQAIAAARDLKDVAAFFVDVDAGSGSAAAGQPVGGMTVIAFNNNHLVYAITWYLLAALVAGAAWRTVVEEKRLRKASRKKQADSAHGNRNDAPQG